MKEHSDKVHRQTGYKKKRRQYTATAIIEEEEERGESYHYKS